MKQAEKGGVLSQPSYRRIETTPAVLAPRNRSAQAAHTRAQLLYAAAQVISQRGFEATSLSDITAVLGKPKTALRYHFENKVDIAVALLEAEYARWVTMRQLMCDTGRQGLAGLVTLLRTFAADTGTGPYQRAAISLSLDAPLIEGDLPTLPFTVQEALGEHLLMAQEFGEIAQDVEIPRAIEGLIDGTLGVILRYRLEPLIDVEDKAEPLWSWTLLGLGVKRPYDVLERHRAIALPPHEIEVQRLRSSRVPSSSKTSPLNLYARFDSATNNSV